MAIIDEVLQVPRDDRSVRLDELCAGERDLRREVESLLEHEDRDCPPVAAAGRGEGVEIFAAALMADTPAAEPPAEQALPEQIGQFRILRMIGQGGMGIIYEAEQQSPRRRVALKVLRPGMMGTGMLKRFQHEAHILGQLQHPGIAHIHEAGVADLPGGPQPFFVMELIDGLPIDAFVERQGLCERASLELLARVCDAVHYAHERGIIHRDLKPANILVIAEGGGGSGEQPLAPLHCGTKPCCSGRKQCPGRPKVLDFGVARITESDLKLVTLQTDVGQLVGTLSYMSPEQVAGGSDAFDRRSDVYTLGVIGHEMLVGKRPHDIRQHTIPEAARIICDEEPSQLGSINTVFRGDVETIISKALEKDRERRYNSAAEMASDIRRFLRAEPIRARPASTFYQLGRFARRNRALVGGVAATIVTLVIGIIAVTWLAMREADAHRDAHQSAESADQAAYHASLSAAAGALRENDVGTAERHLLAAPVALRGWEWDHFQSRLDESLVSAPLVDTAGAGQGGGSMRMDAHIWFSEADQLVHVARFRPGGSSSSRTILVQSLRAATLEPTTSWTLAAVRQVAPMDDGRALLVEFDSGPPALVDAGTGRVTQTLAASPLGPRVKLKDSVPQSLLTQERQFADARLPAEERPGTAVFGPDGALVARFHGAEAVIFAPLEREPALTLEAHREGVADAVFSSDSRFLLTAGYNRRLALFDLHDGGRRVWQQLNAHDDAILAVALSPDGATIATGGQDRVLRFWDMQTGRARGELIGHRDSILGIAFLDDGERLVTCSASQILGWHLAALDDPGIMRHRRSPVKSLAVSADGVLLASSGGPELHLWDLSTGLSVGAWDGGSFGGKWFVDSSFSLDGRHLAIRMTRELIVLDVRTGQIVRRLESSGPGGVLMFDPAGRYLLEGPAEQLRLLDAQTYAPGAVLPPMMGANLQFDPTGRRFAASSPPTISVCDIESGEMLCEWTEPMASSMFLFIDAGRALAAATRDHGIMLFDIDAERSLGVLSGHAERVKSLADLPGQNRLASGSDDRTIRLWDLESMEEVTQLRGHLDAVLDLAVSPDGATLFSASGDYTIRRWETQPLSVLLTARIEYKEIATRLAPRIAALFAQLDDATAVADHVEADETLSKRERQIALQLVLRESLSSAGVDRAANAINVKR